MVQMGDMIFKNGNVGVVKEIKKEHILPQKSFWLVEWDSGAKNIINEATIEQWKECF